MSLKKEEQELEIKINDLDQQVKDSDEEVYKSTIKLGDKASEITDITEYNTKLLEEKAALEKEAIQISSEQKAEITSLQNQKISKFKKFISKIFCRWRYYVKNKQLAKKIKENEKAHAKAIKIQSTLSDQFKQERLKRQNLTKEMEVLHKSLKEMQSKKNNISKHNSKDAFPSKLLTEEIHASQCSNPVIDTKNRQRNTNFGY